MATWCRLIRWMTCAVRAASRTAGSPRRAARSRPPFGGSVRHQMERLILTHFAVTLGSRIESGRR
jgi:hypothetical protein